MTWSDNLRKRTIKISNDESVFEDSMAELAARYYHRVPSQTMKSVGESWDIDLKGFADWILLVTQHTSNDVYTTIWRPFWILHILEKFFLPVHVFVCLRLN